MEFIKIEKKKLKIRSEDLKLRTKKTKHPQQLKAKKARVSGGPGKRVIDRWRSTDERFEIQQISKFKFDILDLWSPPAMDLSPEMGLSPEKAPAFVKPFCSATTFELAILAAEEQARGSA
jgi:hypothetical protein